MPVVPVASDEAQAILTDRLRAAIPTNYDTAPQYNHEFALPLLRLQFDDLGHAGSDVFFALLKGGADISSLVQIVLNLLYSKEYLRPGTRSVTLIVKSFDGVAYTTGSSLDNDHKEICLSADYVHRSDGSNVRQEILGVICHELVHCFQWDAGGTCPGGLIEGLADWVRLRAGLAAKHWKRDSNGEWDRGYQSTAYFLEYLEQRFGKGTVRQINQSLQHGPFDREELFRKCCDNHTVEELWEEYAQDIKETSIMQSKPNQAPLANLT